MADPVSITGLVLQIGVALKQLYDYGKEVKGARKDISALSSELYALRGILEDCKTLQNRLQPQDELYAVLRTAQEALATLLTSLTRHDSKIRRIQQSLSWPIKSDEVNTILVKLERTKSLLLLSLMGEVHESLEDLKEIKGDVKLIARTVGNEAVDRAQREQDEAHRQLLEQIAPVSPETIHTQICSVFKDPSSGSWFLDGVFKQWRQNPTSQQILSLVGKSGAGKSTLVALAIERLKDMEPQKRCHAFMYCSYNDSATRETANIFGAWLAQLCKHRPENLEPISLRRQNRQGIRLSDLADAIFDLSNSLGPILLILDAVNESKEPEKVLHEILQLVERARSIRVLISATTDLMPNVDEQVCQKVIIAPSAIIPDVSTYIQKMRLESAVLQRVPEEDFMSAILPKTNGMFRWASCQMDMVCQYSTPKKVKEALRSLPGSLDQTYVALLGRIPIVSQDLVREALLWLSYSRRPLRLSELIDAVVVEESDEEIDDDCRIYPPEKLITMCEGLIAWNSTTQIVALAHSSVRAFLESDFIRSSAAAFFSIDARTSELSIIRKCLTYLLIQPFAIGYCTKATLADLHGRYPLLEYAATMWALHAQPFAVHGTLGEEELQLIDRLLRTYTYTDGKSNFIFWVYCMIPESGYNVVKAAHPLYYASSFGLTQVVQYMMTQGLVNTDEETSLWYMDCKAGRARSTALQVACWRGHEGVVELLLKAGADPNSTDVTGLTNLACATSKGYSGIVRMLVEAGARPRSLKIPAFPVARRTTRFAEMDLAGTPYRGSQNLHPSDEEKAQDMRKSCAVLALSSQ